MIRVGFVLDVADGAWLGGTSYYRNLFGALADLPDRRIEPVLVAPPQRLEALTSQFPGVAAIGLPLLGLPSVVAKARRVARVISGRDVLMERVMRERGIAVLSHSGYFGRTSPLPSIVWIPDFQELAFPEFFSEGERRARRRNAINSCRHASTLLLSSMAALSDLRKMGLGRERTAVLPFVASVPALSELPPRDILADRYGAATPYFHLPNQFWIHKNHAVVIEALALLRRHGRDMKVIATGNQSDPRQPGHFSSLIEAASRLGVSDLFYAAGIVPYADLMGLMRHSVAVINPSKFEGWSTTVEEAKSMGKAVILSDIPVHREQNPARGSFFPPNDAGLLADHMIRAWDDWDSTSDDRLIEAAAADLPSRRKSFAQRYQDIVLYTRARHSSGKSEELDSRSHRNI